MRPKVVAYECLAFLALVVSILSLGAGKPGFWLIGGGFITVCTVLKGPELCLERSGSS
jgi:hypothetical protein